MHAFIILSKNKKTSLDYIKQECGKNKIDKFDTELYTFEKSIGIEDVRNLQKKIFLKPIKSKTKVVIFDSFNGITVEAQNSLLKLLEEPPNNTIIYIAIQNKDLLLPTILSRCKIIELEIDTALLSHEENTQYLNTLVSLSKNRIGYKLKLAQDIAKNKEETIVWLSKMSIFIREKLIENYNDSKYLNLLTQIQKTYKTIKSTNVSQRIALENLFLSF